MTISELIRSRIFGVIQEGKDGRREITVPYCCDLLSAALGKAPPGCAWVTVVGNVNTLAVAVLRDTACVILAEGTELDEAAREKAEKYGMPVLKSKLPAFETALKVYERMRERKQPGGESKPEAR